jgi:formiminoglutamase
MRLQHPYEFVQGSTPLLISMPHPGLLLPDEVAQLLTSEARALPDTDWHIPQLYGLRGADGRQPGDSALFALRRRPQPAGKTTRRSIRARPPACSRTSCSTAPIFRPSAARSDEVKKECKERIWRPYHGKLMAELNRIKGEFGHAVLLDAHSIRGEIPRLFDGLLPDFNLGTNDGKSCAKSLSDAVVKACDAPGYRHVLNGRFKGGHITRHYGQPDRAFHVVQLELAQRTYMNEQPPFDYRTDLAEKVQPVLQRLVQTLVTWRP